MNFPISLTQEQLTAWIQALRSGAYKQTTGTLRRREAEGEYTYCCLGVCANIVDPTAWLPENEGYNRHYWNGYHNTLPVDIVISQDLNIILYQMNDSQHKTFPEIADWIEENIYSVKSE